MTLIQSIRLIPIWTPQHEFLTNTIYAQASDATLILDPPAFVHVRYTPATLPLTDQAFGAWTSPPPAEDAITLDIVGASYNACMATAQRLAEMIALARGIGTGSVGMRLLIEVMLVDGTRWISQIIGAPDGNALDYHWRPEQDPAGRWVLRDVTARWLRSAWWVQHTVGAMTATTTSQGRTPWIATPYSTFISGRGIEPIRVTLLRSASHFQANETIVLLTGVRNSIDVLGTAFEYPHSSWSSVNLASLWPFNGDLVARFTPSSSKPVCGPYEALNTTFLGTATVAVYASVRASQPMLLRGVVYDRPVGLWGGWNIGGWPGPWRPIPGDNVIRIVSLGTYPLGSRIKLVGVQAVQPSGPPWGTLDLAYLVVHQTDTPISRAMRIYPYATGLSLGTPGMAHYSVHTIRVGHRDVGNYSIRGITDAVAPELSNYCFIGHDGDPTTQLPHTARPYDGNASLVTLDNQVDIGLITCRPNAFRDPGTPTITYTVTVNRFLRSGLFPGGMP